MDSTPAPVDSIVVGLDGSPHSDKAFDWAVEQAALEQRPLTLVHAVETAGVPGSGMHAATGADFRRLADDLRGAGTELLARATTLARERHPELDLYRVISNSDPRSTLLALGEDAAMLVVGSRGRGPVASLLLGSVSVSVSKHAACPVVVRRPTDASLPGQGILVGVDGTEHSLAAVEFAYRMASLRALPLTAVHCYWDAAAIAAARAGGTAPDLSDERALVAESLAGMGARYPEVEVEVRLLRGFADQHLVAASRGCDLLVIGHHRITVLNDLVYGSVAPAVVEHAHGTVAVVPSTLSAALVAQAG